MNVVGITVDTNTNSPIVLLREAEGAKLLPIWIGILEATSIAAQLEKVELSRPMTHDLFTAVLRELGVKLVKIVVTALESNTYFARIHFVDREGRNFDMDARPSDSIAMALRAGAEIYVDESVLAKASALDEKAMEAAHKKLDDKWKELLEEIDPDDLGKYRA
jgi:bifunctional DNase/RNase